MAYTATTILAEVRALLNESTGAFWSDSEINEWVKQGCLDISTKVHAYVTEQTVTLNTAQFKYVVGDEAWIANLVRIKHAWWKDAANARGIPRMEFEQLGHQQANSAGEPRWFLEERQMIWIWPVPSASENATKLYCLASQATDAIANIRYEYQPLVALYAAALAKMKDRKYAEASLYQQMYLNSINYERQDKFDLGKDRITKTRST